MVRRPWLIAQLALVGALVTLALPSSSLALRASFIYLTSSGPSPAAATIEAGLYPVWLNQDTVAHTITFADGCSIEIAAGDSGNCPNGPGNVVGNYAYTVDGTTQASVKVTPEWRGVTVTAKRHGFRRGSKVLLHGHLAIANLSPPAVFGPRMPVVVFERPRGHHVWYRLGVVMAKPLKKPSSGSPYSVWQLWVRPHGGTTYKVEAYSQPKAGKFWRTAWSKPFGVYRRG
jgi:hypothetical protein